MARFILPLHRHRDGEVAPVGRQDGAGERRQLDIVLDRRRTQADDLDRAGLWAGAEAGCAQAAEIASARALAANRECFDMVTGLK